MKSSSNLFLQIPYQIFVFALLVACGTAPTYISTPILTQNTLTLTPAITATPWPPFRYTVFSGDTCASLAFSFNVSEKSIIELNNLQPSCPIEPGQQLLIPYPTASTLPMPTLKPIELVTVTTTLDFHRNGKIYTVIIATAHFIAINQGLYDSLTPPPKIPDKPSDAILYMAKIKEVSDLDNDGEQEYTVLLNECKDLECGNFISYIKIYKYNPEEDNYYVFDEFKTEPEEIRPRFSY